MKHREEAAAGGGNGGASAVTVAGAVRENLERQVEERRRQALAVAQLVGALKSRIDEVSGELARSQEENRALRENIARLEGEYDALVASSRRLYEGFTGLLKAVEDVSGAQVGIDQRIEAVLASSDFGVGIGEQADITPARVGSLIDEAIKSPALQAPAFQSATR